MTMALELGTRRELFIDRFLLAELRDARLQVCPPVRREIVLELNQIAECSASAYYHCFRDGDSIRMYYRGHHPGKSGGDQSDEQTSNYAESTDGIHFTRPDLGIVTFKGSTHNNVLLQAPAATNFFVFKDANPDAKEEERYKAIGGGWEALTPFASEDGLHWHKMQAEKLDIEGTFDSLNVVFWDTTIGKYRMICRYFDQFSDGRKPPRQRANQSCVSDDFIHWTPVVHHAYIPAMPEEEYYTNATIPCPGAEHLLLSFPKRYMVGRKKDTEGMEYPSSGCSDAVLHASRDGVHWHRFLEAWVRPGLDPRNWTHRSNMVAPGIIETAPGEWSMYISEHYGWDDNRLRRLTLAPYRFASLHAHADGGECLTKPFTFTGQTLRLNYATSAAGSIRIELQDEQGNVLPGFAMDDMPALYGDALDQPVRWGEQANLAALHGKPVRMRIELSDADLYAFRFA